MEFRVAIVGATSLKGEELASILRYRQFPTRGVRLLDDQTGEFEPESDYSRRLMEVADEPALVDRLTPEQFDDVDVSFFAGDSKQTLRYWREALNRGSLVVDLTSALEHEPDAKVVGPLLEAELSQTSGPRVVVVAHPAAQVLARLLDSLSRAARLELSAATVFEPVSERGRRGVQELQQQTVNLFSFKPLPSDVFDAQVAFNLRISLGEDSQPTLRNLEQRLQFQLRQLATRSDGTQRFALPALQLIQAPVFHALVLSLFVRFAEQIDGVAIQQALASPDVRSYIDGEIQPDVLQAAGEDRFQVAAVRRDDSVERGYWLFATLDNLRIAALAAVEAAAALLQARRVA
jgi:aspartate-semialdehyde dehydrogenase